MEPHYYNVDIDWQSNRKGILCSPELDRNNGTCIEVATPPDFPKGIKGVWTPEHLFVASVNGCLMTTFLAFAEASSLAFDSFNCKAKGFLEMIEGKLTISEIDLKPTLVIHDITFTDKAMRILKKAKEACLISNSVKSKISMEITIKVNPILIAGV